MVLIKDLGQQKFTENSKEKKRVGLFLCPYCNKEFSTHYYNAIRGKTKSCNSCKGVSIGHKIRKHGYGKHPLIKIHWRMLNCCNNKESEFYHRYGGRGIRVCEEWREPLKFINWCLENGYEKGLTIDRIDNDGNYEPSNCRWVSPFVNASNKNTYKNNKSGYSGIYFFKPTKKWSATVRYENKTNSLGHYYSKKEALEARNKFITDNSLPHIIQEWKDED